MMIMIIIIMLEGNSKIFVLQKNLKHTHTHIKAKTFMNPSKRIIIMIIIIIRIDKIVPVKKLGNNTGFNFTCNRKSYL